MNSNDQQILMLLIFGLIAVMVLRGRRKRMSSTSYGSARFANRSMLKRAKMLGFGPGILFGRTLKSDELIGVRNPCHTLVVGGTGSGKGRGIIIPYLLSLFSRVSCVVLDVKGDLFAISSEFRRRVLGHTIIRLGPLSSGPDRLNPLSFISIGPQMVDRVAALAKAIVARLGTEPEQHWQDKAETIITGVIVYVLLQFVPEERNLNSVRAIISNSKLVDVAAEALQKHGGIPALLGNQILGLQDKEKSGCLSTANRYLGAFLDSELVAESVAGSTFDPRELSTRPMTVYIQLAPEHLESKKGLLRLWLQTLVTATCSTNSSREVHYIIDEASSIGGLPAFEEVLVRGRSAGVRLLLAYQSDSQVHGAFKDKPTLLYDNCSTQIYLGASSIESAKRLSEMCGEATITISTSNSGGSSGYSRGGQSTGREYTSQYGNSYGINVSEKGRPLLTPSEILAMNNDFLLAFVSGMSPIMARKLKWDQEPLFNRKTNRLSLRWMLVFLFIAVVVIAMFMDK